MASLNGTTGNSSWTRAFFRFLFFGREGWLVSTDCCLSALERVRGPPRVVELHWRSRVTYKGQETPRVPLHHASHGPPPPKGEERQLTTPKPTSPLPHRPVAPFPIGCAEFAAQHLARRIAR